MFLYFFCLIFYCTFCFPLVFFNKSQLKLSNKTPHGWSMLWWRFLVLPFGSFSAYITLGFLCKSLTQCGLCLPKMTLTLLSLPADIFRASTRSSRIVLMLSVSQHYVTIHLLTFSALIVYLQFHMLVPSVPSICQHKINGLFVHCQFLEMVLSNRWRVLVSHQLVSSMVNNQ